ncbi:MAG: acylphosphatase [Sphingobacteriales bacterium]
MRQTISILVRGKVQGVYYRHYTKTKAEELGITGTVKNLPDGSVYIIATGEDYQITDLLNYCKQGPPKAVVSEVIKEEILLQNFTSFQIIR